MKGRRWKAPWALMWSERGSAGESDEALKLGITKVRLGWVSAKAECGRGRPGAKNGTRSEREMLSLSL